MRQLHKTKAYAKSLNSECNRLARTYPLLLSQAVEVTLLDNFIFMEHGTMYHGFSFRFIFITEMTRLFLSTSESPELCHRFAHASKFQRAGTVHTRFRRIQITRLLFPPGRDQREIESRRLKHWMKQG